METFDRDRTPNASGTSIFRLVDIFESYRNKYPFFDEYNFYSDHWADFTYRTQPDKCKWCLERMADVLALILPVEDLDKAIQTFDVEFRAEFLMKMRTKVIFKNAYMIVKICIRH